MMRVEKQMPFNRFEELEGFIHSNTQKKEYYLNNFPRKSYEKVI